MSSSRNLQNVMLTRNLWFEVDLDNGTRREAVDIAWSSGQRALALPKFVVVRLEGCTGPAWSFDTRYEGCAPIAQVETTCSATGDGVN